jgi:hypothetical protein
MTTEMESKQKKKSSFITTEHKGQSPICVSIVTFNRDISPEARKSVFTKNKREQ